MVRKIGILTHHYINNYGAFLQAWALAETIEKLFPRDEVRIINYVNIKHFLINTAGWFRYYRNRESLKMWREKTKLPLTFSAARKKYLKMTPLCFSARKINDKHFDCIVIGSDEVWNYTDSKANAKIKFGTGLTCGKLISYAPSAGKTTPEDPIPGYVRKGIRSFDSLSARDENTKKMVESITDKTCTIVLDPAFLAEFPETKRVISKEKYILFYYCEKLPEEILRKIIDYANQNNYRIYGAGECGKIFDDITVNLSPFEWVEFFRHAEYVFTGTFHGAVFSIINRRQFGCYLTKKSRIRKVNDLLDFLAIGDRTLTSEMDILSKVIDYEAVFKIIDEKKEISLDYLINSIGRDETDGKE